MKTKSTGAQDAPARQFAVLMMAACPFPSAQGTQVYVGQMASWLAHRGHRISLVTYHHGTGDTRAFDAAAPYQMCRAMAVPGLNSLASGPSWEKPLADALLVLRGLEAVANARRAGQPYDLIHAHNYEGALAGVLVGRLTGLPVLYHAHNLMGDELPTYFQDPQKRALAGWFGRTLDRVVPGLADRCLAVSRHAQARLASLHRIPVRYHPPAVEEIEPLRTFSNHKKGRWAIYTGNLDGYQSPEVMFAALARSKARCVVVTADQPERWQPWLERYGLGQQVQVVPHGDFDHVRGWLAGAAVALLPRRVASGFPIKLINYLAAGCPVVACRGGAQGLGRADGVWTVPDGDEAAFAQALEALLHNGALSDELGTAAQRAAQNFGWPTRGAAIEAEYAALVAAHGRAKESGGKGHDGTIG